MSQDDGQSIVKLFIIIMVGACYSVYQYMYQFTDSTSLVVPIDPQIFQRRYDAYYKPFIDDWRDADLQEFLNANSSCTKIRNSMRQESGYPIAYSLVVHRNASEVVRLITSLYQVTVLYFYIEEIELSTIFMMNSDNRPTICSVCMSMLNQMQRTS